MRSAASGDGLADVAHPDRRAVAIGEDDVVVWLRPAVIWSLAAIVKLVLSVLMVPLAALVVALTSVPRISSSVTPRCGELRRIDLNADRRHLVAEDRDLRHPRYLGNLLGEEAVARNRRLRSAACVSERAESSRIGESAGLTFL